MSKRPQAILAVVLLLAGAVFYGYRLSRRPLRRAGLPTASDPSSNRGIPANPVPEPASPGNLGAAASPVVMATVLRPGETLEFAANVTKLNSTVANLKVVVGEKRSLAGKSVWHLQAFVHTQNPYRMVFELDDQFDSYSEPTALTSVQYEMHLSERGQKVDSVQRLFSSTKDPAPPDAAAARVLPGTRDPLGFLHYLRNVDWSNTPEVHSPVYDGRKLYDVRAVLKSKSVSVSVPAGDFSASKIEIHVMENGSEMKDAHFLLYLNHDAARTPVLMEAVLPFATVRVELTNAK